MPEISIEKEVRVNGGAWLPSQVSLTVGPGVTIEYRFIIRNTGLDTLESVTVTDVDRGLNAVSLPDLFVGGELIIDSTVPGFEDLNFGEVPGCEEPVVHTNTATVAATGSSSGTAVSDSSSVSFTCVLTP